MYVRDITFDNSLFNNKDRRGRLLTGAALGCNFLVIFPANVEDYQPLVVLKDETITDFESDISKPEHLSFLTERPVLVPINGDKEINRDRLEAIVNSALEELYELGVELDDEVIMVGFDIELENVPVSAYLSDDGIESLTISLNEIEGNTKKVIQ